MIYKRIGFLAIAAAFVVLGAACTKKATVTVDNVNLSLNVPINSATIPSGTTTGDFSTTVTNTATPSVVTITAAGVSPKTLRVAVGTTVTFVNTDTIAHQIASDPHPAHTGLPGFDNTAARESYSYTFTRAGTFSYHDHLDDTNTAMNGTIIVE